MMAEALKVQALVDTRGARTINRDGCLLINLNAAWEGSDFRAQGEQYTWLSCADKAISRLSERCIS